MNSLDHRSKASEVALRNRFEAPSRIDAHSSAAAVFNISDGDVAALESAILTGSNNDDDISTGLDTVVTC
jgi:hypothetical protein